MNQFKTEFEIIEILLSHTNCLNYALERGDDKLAEALMESLKGRLSRALNIRNNNKNT